MRTAASWNGAPSLRALLVTVDELRTHNANARRGDVAAITRSLERFGQQRPVLALSDGVIVAGNHTYMAATTLGWSHIAVVRSDLSRDEADAYLLADNRTSDLSTYDERALADLLRPRYEADTLLGTGYSRENVEQLFADVAWRDRFTPGEPPRPLDEFVQRTCPHCGGAL